MKICVRLHDLGKSDALTLAKRTKEYNFDGVQLVINKAIEGESGLPGTLTDEKLSEISLAFQNENIEVAMLGAYFNPVHSDKNLVATNIEKFKEYLGFANRFNCKYVGSETGSFNDNKWTYNPLNRTEEAFQEVKRIFKDLANHAEKCNSFVAIEGADGHCMYCPDQLYRLYKELDSKHVKIIVDIYNYLNEVNYSMEYQHKTLDRCIELFKDEIVLFHLKDFIVVDGKLKQVGLGEGIMDLENLVLKMQKFCPNAYLIFEGVPFDKMKSSLQFIKNIIK